MGGAHVTGIRRAQQIADIVPSQPSGVLRRCQGQPCPPAGRHGPLGGTGVKIIPAAVNEALAGSGQPLEQAARTAMELRFQHDFSAVRVHTDKASSEAARSNARNLWMTVEGPYPPGDLEALKQDRRCNAGREGTARAHRSSWSRRR